MRCESAGSAAGKRCWLSRGRLQPAVPMNTGVAGGGAAGTCICQILEVVQRPCSPPGGRARVGNYRRLRERYCLRQNTATSATAIVIIEPTAHQNPSALWI